MKTIEVNLYKLNELSEDAKERAISKLWDINVDYQWWDSLYMDAESIGLEITGFDLDRRRHAEGSFNLSPCEVAQNIFNNHGDECETTKTARRFMNEWQPIFDEYMDQMSENYESGEYETKMIDLESEFLNSLLEDYSILLEKEYEYLTGKDAVIETIEANDYDFTEDGKLY